VPGSTRPAQVDRSIQRVRDREGGRAELDVVALEDDCWQNEIANGRTVVCRDLPTSDHAVAPVFASDAESSNKDADALCRATLSRQT
jgi:hypothetical protein